MIHELLRLQHKNPKKVIGLMSGTSADGIDACLVEILGNGLHTKINILAFETYSYDKPTRTAILDTCNPETGTVDKVCQLNFHLGKLFANAATSIANKAHISIKDIDLIGSHGQTIYHIPNPETISKSKVRSNNYVTVPPHLNLPHQGGGIQGNNEYSPPLVGGVRGGGELLQNEILHSAIPISPPLEKVGGEDLGLFSHERNRLPIPKAAIEFLMFGGKGGVGKTTIA